MKRWRKRLEDGFILWQLAVLFSPSSPWGMRFIQFNITFLIKKHENSDIEFGHRTKKFVRKFDCFDLPYSVGWPVGMLNFGTNQEPRCVVCVNWLVNRKFEMHKSLSLHGRECAPSTSTARAAKVSMLERTSFLAISFILGKSRQKD